MPLAAFLLIIIGVMIFTGLLGGLVNYFLARKNDPENSGFWKSITLGIAASFLVPLFLNMISSSLLETIRGTDKVPQDLTKIFVFSGFCLIAAISSTAFIKTLSDRILQEAREAKKVAHEAEKKASEAQSVIQPIVDKATEADASTADSIALKANVPTVNDREAKVLQALATGEYVLRTRTGLAKDTGIPKPEVDEMMEDLKKRGLVGYKWIVEKKGTNKRMRWYVTNDGRASVARN